LTPALSGAHKVSENGSLFLEKSLVHQIGTRPCGAEILGSGPLRLFFYVTKNGLFSPDADAPISELPEILFSRTTTNYRCSDVAKTHKTAQKKEMKKSTMNPEKS